MLILLIVLVTFTIGAYCACAWAYACCAFACAYDIYANIMLVLASDALSYASASAYTYIVLVQAWYADRPEVRRWQEKVIENAKKTGFSRTLMGRYINNACFTRVHAPAFLLAPFLVGGCRLGSGGGSCCFIVSDNIERGKYP